MAGESLVELVFGEQSSKIGSTEPLKCPHGRPVYLGPCYLCEQEALNRA